jgi:hypothetical protein
MNMEFGFLIYPMRALQALFSIIVLSVLSYGSHPLPHPPPSPPPSLTPLPASHSWTSQLNWTPSRISFLIFASAWTLLALLYLVLVPRFSKAEIHRHGLLVIESLTTIFWFAGFIALAVFLGDGRSCDGSWGPCRAAEAGDVFAAFEWYVVGGLVFCHPSTLFPFFLWYILVSIAFRLWGMCG